MSSDKIKMDQYGGVIMQPYVKREPKVKTKSASRVKTPKVVIGLQVILAKAKREGDAHAVAAIERVISEFFETANRKAAARARKGKTPTVQTLVF